MKHSYLSLHRWNFFLEQVSAHCIRVTVRGQYGTVDSLIPPWGSRSIDLRLLGSAASAFTHWAVLPAPWKPLNIFFFFSLQMRILMWKQEIVILELMDRGDRGPIWWGSIKDLHLILEYCTMLSVTSYWIIAYFLEVYSDFEYILIPVFHFFSCSDNICFK